MSQVIPDDFSRAKKTAGAKRREFVRAEIQTRMSRDYDARLGKSRCSNPEDRTNDANEPWVHPP